jgi:hypothetical protein
MKKAMNTLLKSEVEQETLDFDHPPGLRGEWGKAWQSLHEEITDSASAAPEEDGPTLSTQWMGARRRRIQGGL